MIHQLFDPSGTLSEISGYWAFGEARFGGNGVGWMPPEFAVGTSAEDMAAGRILWDDDLSDGFDSGQIGVAFELDLTTGDASLGAGTNSYSEAAEFEGSSGGDVGSIVLRVGAQVPASVSWSGLSIIFWTGNQQGETLTLSTGLSVDTASSTTGVGERLLSITPENTGYDRVTIFGNVRLQAGSEVYPGWTDLFAQVLIMPAD